MACPDKRSGYFVLDFDTVLNILMVHEVPKMRFRKSSQE